MALNSGNVRARHCPFCGRSYKYSNFMKRRDGYVDFAGDTIALDDRHKIACWNGRPTLDVKGEISAWRRPDGSVSNEE